MEQPQHPMLPPELERLIFEEAALGDKTQIPRLCQVAHRVYQWIHPLQYRVLIQPSDNKFSPPTPTTQNTGVHVRHALFTVSAAPDSVLHCLSLCQRVENLAVWPRFGNDGRLLALLTPLPLLRRLSINLLTLFCSPPDFHNPVFRNITHLDVVDPVCEWDEDNNLSHIKKLTHLAFNDRVPMQTLLKILEKCDGLQVLVLLGDAIPKCLDSFGKDPRVVTKVRSGFGGWVMDWTKGTEQGGDFWSRAEVIVDKQRNRTTGKADGSESTEPTESSKDPQETY